MHNFWNTKLALSDDILMKIEKPVKEPVRKKTIISPEQIDKLIALNNSYN
mgnify:CR=1 FL=1